MGEKDGCVEGTGCSGHFFFGLGATRKTSFVNTGETKLANKDQTKVPSGPF